MSVEKMECKCLSRRKVLVGAGALAASTALMQFGGMLKSANAKDGSTEKWPWPYEKLDPTTSAELAYKEWYRVFCGGAVISSIFSQLREKVGEPYKSFPIDAFICLEGGMVGWGTLCGSNAGASIVSNVIIGPRIAGPASEHGHSIASDTLEWYSETAMPVFVPKTPKQPTKIVQTTSNSPLCHVSVGKWMAASGFAVGSPERKDRCARMAASVTYHLVESLNAWKDGKYEPESEWMPAQDIGIPAQPECGACHGNDVPTPPMAAAKKS
jgi:hypothetical protein